MPIQILAALANLMIFAYRPSLVTLACILVCVASHNANHQYHLKAINGKYHSIVSILLATTLLIMLANSLAVANTQK